MTQILSYSCRNYGRTNATIIAIKEAFDKNESVLAAGLNDPSDYLNRLLKLGVRAVATPVFRTTQERYRLLYQKSILCISKGCV